MKLITHLICQTIVALVVLVCYAILDLIACTMFNTAHVPQFTPICTFVFLLCSLSSIICNVKSAHLWAQGTIERQYGMPLSYAVRNPGRVITDFLPGKQEQLAQQAVEHLTDCSHLFTGMDTSECQQEEEPLIVDSWIVAVEHEYYSQK